MFQLFDICQRPIFPEPHPIKYRSLAIILAPPVPENEVTFKVNGPAQPILTFEGKDILLSCHLSPKMDAQNMTIKWFQGQTLVHRYHIWKEVEETKGPEFEGRTELMKHDLAKGKATLKMYKVQLSDSGNYTCHFRSPYYYNEAHFGLQVLGDSGSFSKEPKLCTAVWIVVLFAIVFIILAFIVYSG
ncbi:butyrophilin-like protein 9 [Gracilinanus agilis]|uniref:butyrophilin-like protein 9 n=1 Tax=Gracilinanus agilis TaxID=191870 RepID=UPI001CFD8973|nr:butyrophilin-like protein 9 [Gracilinanus agilis]